ncbi:hypothetical protein D3C84_1195250 [compost metagenome]
MGFDGSLIDVELEEVESQHHALAGKQVVTQVAGLSPGALDHHPQGPLHRVAVLGPGADGGEDAEGHGVSWISARQWPPS